MSMYSSSAFLAGAGGYGPPESSSGSLIQALALLAIAATLIGLCFCSPQFRARCSELAAGWRSFFNPPEKSAGACTDPQKPTPSGPTTAEPTSVPQSRGRPRAEENRVDLSIYDD
jgi:hypothetical protein